MSVTECEVPFDSVLGRELVDSAYFHDSYRAPLTQPELGITDIYAGIFGHVPLPMKLMLITRNAIVRIFGLQGPTVAEVMRAGFKRTSKRPCAVGDKLGLWRVFFINEDEIIAGTDDRHLDFRLSVLRARSTAAASVTVTTICSVHNFFGKFYLFFIVPYHRYAVRKLLSNAIAAKRL